MATMVVQLGLATMPLGMERSSAALASGTTSGHVGVHAPGRGVVDHDGAGRGQPRRQGPRHGGRGGAQGEVDAGEVGRLGVLDDDVAVAPGQRRAGGAGGGEIPHGLHREAALGQDGAQDHAHLPSRSDDGDPHRPIVRDGASALRPRRLRPRAAGAPRARAPASARRRTRDRRPTGSPLASRETTTPRGMSSRATSMAVASPSMVGLVQTMASRMIPASMRSSSSRRRSCSRPMPSSGLNAPPRTW